MEVGAVKQAFNNEVILLKKKLNQAKIQIIHKLTRKAKQLTEKKAPEQLKEKLKRKAESAVKEVLIIKKIKAKDIAKFIVTHKGELNSYLNKPQVDEDKACARLLLHKVLQDKYKFIRDRFSNVPIQDLFMSRLERRKMKKEAKEKQKNKKKGKNNKVVNAEGDWDVEDVAMTGSRKVIEDDDVDDEKSGDEAIENDVSSEENVGDESPDDESDHSEMDDEQNDVQAKNVLSDNESESEVENSDEEVIEDSKLVKPIPKEKLSLGSVKSNILNTEEINSKSNQNVNKINPSKDTAKKNPMKKQKESSKNKNFNEKILKRKFKKDTESTVIENKIVDPFFITATGENYMSVVEPRPPDEIKKEHMQGNRKLRRAVMFGHVPKSKLRKNNNYYNEDNRFNNHNGNDRGNSFKGTFNDRTHFKDKKNFNNKPQYNDRNNFNDRNTFNTGNDRNNDDKPEKLHPSWEAKKKKSGILPFEGKKIVFDEG